MIESVTVPDLNTDCEAGFGWIGTSSTRAKGRALRSAWTPTLEKCLTPPTLLERRCFASWPLLSRHVGSF